MPRIAQLYFKTAIIFLIIGIGMGLQMAISDDHTALGAHAHNNLLGWVTMALFGCYHAFNPRKAEKRLAMLQYYVYTAGLVVLVPSLYLLLEGNMAMGPVVGISSIVVFIGVLMFAAIIFSGEESTATSPKAASR